VVEKQLDALIQAGWHVFESDFDHKAFLRWRKQAYECVSLLVGADHPYTEHLRLNIKDAEPSCLLTDVGVLTAAKLLRLQGVTWCVANQTREVGQAGSEESFGSDAAPLQLSENEQSLSEAMFEEIQRNEQ
jgi:hypothetical protein